MDYLSSQVLVGEAPEVQDFMIKASILEHFSASLCDAVLGGHRFPVRKNTKVVFADAHLKLASS